MIIPFVPGFIMVLGSHRDINNTFKLLTIYPSLKGVLHYTIVLVHTILMHHMTLVMPFAATLVSGMR